MKAWVSASQEHWHNASSLYPGAVAAKEFLEGLREELAGMLGCEAGRVVFNSGATESNHAVLMWAAKLGKPVLVGAVEHPSVAEAAEQLIEPGRLMTVGVTGEGVVCLEEFDRSFEERAPGLVSLMAANNETGVLQPWREVLMRCHERGIPFHCDAAQWIGKMPLAGLSGCDFVTASAHKFGGPKGVGFLLIPKGSDFRSQIGGPQERGVRGGTENLAAIAAMVAALKAAGTEDSGEHRDRFEVDLLECLEGTRLLGAGAPRLGNTSMFVLPEHKNLRWLTRLGRRGVAVSTGSACRAGKGDPSRVMQAMGGGFEEMGRVLRVSSLPDATAEDWEALLDALLEVRDELGSGRRTSAKGIRKISLEDF